MNEESGCPTRVLAAGPVCRVERCGHGTLHLTLGVLTLRLTDRQLEEIAATLEVAASRLSTVSPQLQARMLC